MSGKGNRRLPLIPDRLRFVNSGSLRNGCPGTVQNGKVPSDCIGYRTGMLTPGIPKGPSRSLRGHRPLLGGPFVTDLKQRRVRKPVFCFDRDKRFCITDPRILRSNQFVENLSSLRLRERCFTNQDLLAGLGIDSPERFDRPSATWRSPIPVPYSQARLPNRRVQDCLA